MRTPKVHRKRRGAVLAWTAVSLTTLFGMAALSIDMGYLYTVKADLQNAADAAALAATITMFDVDGLNEEAAKTTALRVAARNLDVPPQVADDIMDFTIGRFDDPFNHDQNFIPLADDDSNAVRIVLHRTAERGQPVRLFFAAAIGRHQADVSAFAIAGKDRKFVAAQAKIVGQSVEVSSPDVSAPVSVRYAWADNPIANLVNAASLPASPFRTDDWNLATTK